MGSNGPLDPMAELRKKVDHLGDRCDLLQEQIDRLTRAHGKLEDDVRNYRTEVKDEKADRERADRR